MNLHPVQRFNWVDSLLRIWLILVSNVWGGLATNVTNSSSGELAWKNLKWGFATSAYQIEGGWNVTGKGQSVWDNFTHQVPSPIVDGSNGDVACDSYNLYRKDVELLSSLGAQVYRFSMAWSRLLPDGTRSSFDPDGAGVKYYLDLLQALEDVGIEPIVTLHHFDHPQALEDRGGFLNASLIIGAFRDYAEIAFATFGDRVKKWITFNEPWVTCVHGYRTGKFAPGKVETESSKGSLLCGHNLLKAHAEAYRLYHRKFKEQGGVVGMSLFAPWFNVLEDLDYWPYSPDEDDKIAAEYARAAVIGWFAQPLMKGSYPEALNRIYGEWNMPKFNAAWVKAINGSVDFLGVNHYTTFEVANRHWYKEDSNMSEFYTYPYHPRGGSKWLAVVPFGFRRLLQWIQKEYSSPVIYITENGFSDPSSGSHRIPGSSLTQDFERSHYLFKYLAELKSAIIEDSINVQVYAVWSLLDNWEWTSGHTESFGVVGVDFTSANRTRVKKGSACGLDWVFNKKRWGKGGSQGEYCGNNWFKDWDWKAPPPCSECYMYYAILIVPIVVMVICCCWCCRELFDR